jgi:hypothetical protein
MHYVAFAKDKPVDATESLIYMCGMAPLDPDDPYFDIFRCDPSLDCDTHIESEFYTSKIQSTRVKMFCNSAASMIPRSSSILLYIRRTVPPRLL